jgi:hypothetical protein
MALDPDIFGSPAAEQAGDPDIFKDLPAQEAPERPKMEAKVPTPKELAIQKAMSGGWGTGLPKAAYAMGGAITDMTGLPSLGAAASVIPDAIQMAFGGAVGKTAAPLLESAGKFFMSSAMKPTLDQVKRGRAAPAIKTMLDEGFNPTAGGVEVMKSTLNDLGSQVRDSISKSGAMIDTRTIADYVPQAYPRFQNGPLAVPAIEDLGKVQANFLDHPNILGAREIPVQLAQDMKTGYQKAIGDKGYDALKTPGTEGEKQIARGLREQIAAAVPAVSSPLARESNIINALKIAERRVAVDANKNPVGLGWLGQPWMIPFWMWDRSALAKSLTARALYSGKEAIPGTIGTAAGALHGVMQDRDGMGALYAP